MSPLIKACLVAPMLVWSSTFLLLIGILPGNNAIMTGTGMFILLAGIGIPASYVYVLVFGLPVYRWLKKKIMLTYYKLALAGALTSIVTLYVTALTLGADWNWPFSRDSYINGYHLLIFGCCCSLAAMVFGWIAGDISSFDAQSDDAQPNDAQ